MKILIQWTLSSPQDWVEIDEHAWSGLAKHPVPSGGEVIDQQPGWIFDVCIQGWCLRGCDHIALEPFAGGVRVYRWFDDLADDETDYRHGQVIEFRPGWVDRTLTLSDGSTMRHQGPDQRLVQFAENMDAHRPFVAQECGGLPVEFRPWSEWVNPPDALVRHGIWLGDHLLHAHLATQQPALWREWM